MKTPTRKERSIFFKGVRYCHIVQDIHSATSTLDEFETEIKKVVKEDGRINDNVLSKYEEGVEHIYKETCRIYGGVKPFENAYYPKCSKPAKEEFELFMMGHANITAYIAPQLYKRRRPADAH